MLARIGSRAARADFRMAGGRRAQSDGIIDGAAEEEVQPY
jgi:hypothetical protein